MRLVVFFDLPVDTAAHRKAYRLFRKFLVKDGYLMLQESVYAKLVTNEQTSQTALSRLRKNRPTQGLVQVLKVTEKQFATMVYITGSRADVNEVTTTDELVIV